MAPTNNKTKTINSINPKLMAISSMCYQFVSVMMTILLPLPQLWAAKQTVRRVGALQNKAGKDISVLVEKLYNQMMNYRNQMTSIDASLAFAEEYLRMKNAAFLEGMSSSTDLIDAELNLAGVRTERLQAAYNFDLLLAQLLEAAGISDEFSAYARRADARPILFDKK